MPDYKINGQKASPEEWGRLRELFTDKSEPFWLHFFPPPPFDDDQLSPEELQTLLDSNKNGHISFDDLTEREWSVAQFNSLRGILERHGFSQFDFRKDRATILAEVGKNPSSLRYADPSFQSDREIVLEAVKQDGWTLKYASTELQGDREIALTAVGNRSQSLEFVAEEFRKDPEFLLEAARLNINVIVEMTNRFYDPHYNALFEKIWKEFLAPSPDAPPPSYDEWREAIAEKYGIEFLERFRSPQVLRAILDARDNLGAAATKPVAVVIGPKTDWNQGFETYPLLDRLYELGYSVLYYENNDDKGINRTLRDATQNGGRKADLIVLAGHGTATEIKIGKVYNSPFALVEKWIRGESLYVDAADFAKNPKKIALQNYLKTNGNVILYACSTGEGRESNPNNLANTLANQFPSGTTIYAATRHTNIILLDHDQRGKLVVSWREDAGYTTSGKN